MFFFFPLNTPAMMWSFMKQMFTFILLGNFLLLFIYYSFFAGKQKRFRCLRSAVGQGIGATLFNSVKDRLKHQIKMQIVCRRKKKKKKGVEEKGN